MQLSYHGKPEVKERHVAMAKAHAEMDMLRAGTYGVGKGKSFKAWSAKLAAEAAESARLAAWSARSAESAESAESAAYQQERDDLLDLLRSAEAA